MSRVRPRTALEPSTPPFRLRVLVLVVAALAVGLGALVLALTAKKTPAATVPRPSSEPPWPDGFVEWTELPASASKPAPPALSTPGR